MIAAGEDVVMVDGWPENVEAIRRSGIRVEGMRDEDTLETPARILHIGDMQSLVREAPIDIAFIAVKSYDTAWATQLALGYLASDGVVVSLQNSLNEPTIAAIAGSRRTAGCAISSLACELIAPRVVKRMTGRGKQKSVLVGEVEGPARNRTEEIARLVSHAELSATTDNLEGVKWSKLVINAMRNGLSAMTGMTGWERDTDPVTRWLGIRLGGQAVRVGKAIGLKLENAGLDFEILARAAEGNQDAIEVTTAHMLAIIAGRSADQRPSMGQDIRKGRRTETDAINGLVARRGREVGVDATLHENVNQIIRRIERGEIEPSPALAEGL